jgi:hypothetical protein
MVADGSHGIKPLTNIGVDSSGRIATYKGNGTSGSGVPAEYFGALGTGLTANYNSGSPATLVTPAIANSAYRICYFEAVTQVGTVSGTAPSGTIGYTDSGGIARTQQLFATNSTNTTATVAGQGCTVIATNSSTPVTFTGAGYATSGAASLNYELMIVLEQLQ